MNRLIIWVLGGALLAAAAGLMIANAQQPSAPALIAGDQPVTAEQVREKLQSDGWSNVVVLRNGRYIEATGSLNGQAGKTVVDSQTGRLRADDGEAQAGAFVSLPWGTPEPFENVLAILSRHAAAVISHFNPTGTIDRDGYLRPTRRVQDGVLDQISERIFERMSVSVYLHRSFA